MLFEEKASMTQQEKAKQFSRKTKQNKTNEQAFHRKGITNGS